jgi:hypothetical protein
MIKCARLECKYRSDRTGNCQCKKVILSAWNVATVNMGRKDFLECKSFEESDEYIRLKNKMRELRIFDDLVEKVD